MVGHAVWFLFLKAGLVEGLLRSLSSSLTGLLIWLLCLCLCVCACVSFFCLWCLSLQACSFPFAHANTQKKTSSSPYEIAGTIHHHVFAVRCSREGARGCRPCRQRTHNSLGVCAERAARDSSPTRHSHPRPCCHSCRPRRHLIHQGQLLPRAKRALLCRAPPSSREQTPPFASVSLDNSQLSKLSSPYVCVCVCVCVCDRLPQRLCRRSHGLAMRLSLVSAPSTSSSSASKRSDAKFLLL